MLVRREIIVMGDNLNQLLRPIQDRAEIHNYQIVSVAHGIKFTETHSNLSFVLDIESNQLRVWHGPPTEEEETVGWNQLLARFFHSVVKPVCDTQDASCELTPEDRDIDYFFSPLCVNLLREVVSLEPGSTTRENKWAQFVIEATLDKNGRNAFELVTWLEEQEESKEAVNQMLDDYHKAHSILTTFFRHYPDSNPRRRAGIS